MKPMTEYQKFRESLKEMEIKGFGSTDKYVIIPRKIWGNSQKQYNEYMENEAIQKIIERAIQGGRAN